MRKHNKQFATRWGSARVDSGAPKMAHQITNNKDFQLAANHLLRCILIRGGCHAGV